MTKQRLGSPARSRRLLYRSQSPRCAPVMRGRTDMPQPARPRNVGILIFPDVEILDFCGPFEVFASATLPAETDGGPETRLFEVFTIAERSQVVPCRGVLFVQPTLSRDVHPPLDLVLIPGGYGARRQQENPVVL